MRRGVFPKVAVTAAVLALVAAACERGGDEARQPGQQQQQSLLQVVQDRGTLQCGVNETVPGFGFDPGTGELEGFDVDFCRAIAAAVLGDPEAIELTPVDAEERLNALRAGQYDVLVRNTTHTSSRDGTEGISFAHVNFYDGQGMMVASDSDFEEVADMDGTDICVTTGTTTELNLADYASQVGVDIDAVTFAENPDIQEAWIGGRCDGWTSDASQLAALRSAFPPGEGGPESLRILGDIMSKEPLAPAVVDGDTQWYDVVNWVVNGIILAEELGVTSENVEEQANNPDNPGIAALLGVPFEAETETITVSNGLGIEDTFMQDVLAAVGNYGEIFDRHLTPIGLDRGLNALWTDGGIQYGIPIR